MRHESMDGVGRRRARNGGLLTEGNGRWSCGPIEGCHVRCNRVRLFMGWKFRTGIGTLPSEEYASWVAGSPCPACGRPALMKLAIYLPGERSGSPVAHAYEHEHASCREYDGDEGLRRLQAAGLIEEVP